MTTNIIATLIITLITNVVETDNSKGCQHAPGVTLLGYGNHFCSTYYPPTERYLTTNVTERTTLRWEWKSEKHEQNFDKALSSITQIFKLKQEWEPVVTLTNINWVTERRVLRNFVITNDSLLITP